MLWWQALLFPFAIIYDLITRIRNYLYDRRGLSSFKFEANVISIGNLSVGGTGKTPMIEFITEYLVQKNLNVSSLSRGYGRKSKGFREVNVYDDSTMVGDEPLMLKKKYPDHLKVFVGEKRVEAVPTILSLHPDTDVILLDDAFQHRAVRPSLSILLTTYGRPFFKDFVLPSGWLREARANASRADAVVVTKCPEDLGYSEKREIKSSIQQYAPENPVFFSSVRLMDPVPLFDGGIETKNKVISVAAIANPDHFFGMLEKKYEIKGTLGFSDHYEFTKADVSWMIKMMERENAMLCCTTKDSVKLQKFEELKVYPTFEVPMNMEILDDPDQFFTLIENSLQDYSGDFNKNLPSHEESDR